MPTLWSPATISSLTSSANKDYLNGKLTAITYVTLMSSAKRKFDWLKTKGTWGANSPDNKKIVANGHRSEHPKGPA
jgi:hypothetical protein